MIIRRRYTANFTTIDNKLFDDERLSADEVGILAYLRSRPHDWEVRRPALMRRWNIGRDSVKRVITSLVRYGWGRPERTRLANGTYYMIYEIRDEPGPTLTDEEVRRALSLVSGEAAADDLDGSFVRSEADSDTSDPPTENPSWMGDQPSLAEPSPDNPYMAYKDIQNKDLPRTDSTQKIEREHERAKEKHALNLAEFKRRWPTIAADDQTRVDNAWFALTLDEGDAALAGITPFLENQKRLKKSHPPAGFNYLGQKRWTLLEQPSTTVAASIGYPRDSIEGRALIRLHDVCGVGEGFRKIYCRDVVTYRKEMTPQIKAFAEMPPREEWQPINYQQAGAWTSFCKEVSSIPRTKIFRAGDLAPWAFEPSVEGKLYPHGPPETLMTEQDMADFK